MAARLESILENRTFTGVGTVVVLLLILLLMSFLAATDEDPFAKNRRVIEVFSFGVPKPPPAPEPQKADEEPSDQAPSQEPAVPKFEIPNQPQVSAITPEIETRVSEPDLSDELIQTTNETTWKPRVGLEGAIPTSFDLNRERPGRSEGAGEEETGIDLTNAGGSGEDLGGGDEDVDLGSGTGVGTDGPSRGQGAGDGLGVIPALKNDVVTEIEDQLIDELAEWLRDNLRPFCPTVITSMQVRPGDLTTIQPFRIDEGRAQVSYTLYISLREASRTLKVWLIKDGRDAYYLVDQRKDRVQDYKKGSAIATGTDPYCITYEQSPENPLNAEAKKMLEVFFAWWEFVKNRA
jgi:hypothetical protein